ncbi:MAG: TetR family transcriptional regulator, partial [Pseudomonadota bacterium]|nr:TetR family transcriptional regulator [Pseudomonadota bacterium]
PFGLLRAKGLLAVWLITERVWLGDDSPDLGPTMAALDRNLRRAEKFATQLDRFDRPVSAKFIDEGGLKASPETD